LCLSDILSVKALKEETMKQKDQKKFAEDLQYEGRDKVYVDVDRMINEGMAGGTVHRLDDTPNIEESHDLPPEDPPNE
jgi:hypothetical protein